MRTPTIILTALLASSFMAFAQNGYPQPYNAQDPQDYGSPSSQQYGNQPQQYDQDGNPIQQQGSDQQQGYNQNYDNGQQAYEESQEAPPALPVYTQPVAPGYGYIWTPGYWAYTPYGYQWVAGTWVLPPYQNALWTPGYWGYNADVYFWNPGYWGTSIGYYGGINYGFGYFGDGFYGGGWNNGIFFYNTAYWNCGRYDRYHYDRDDWREVREEHERRGDREWLRNYGDHTAHLDHGVFHPQGPAFAHIDHLQPAQRAALIRGKANIGQGHMVATRNEAVVARSQQAANVGHRNLQPNQTAGRAPITRNNPSVPGAYNRNQQTGNVHQAPAPVTRYGASGSGYNARQQQQQPRPFAGGVQRPQQTYSGNGYPHAVYQQQHQNQQLAQQQNQPRPQLQYRPQQQQQARPQQQQYNAQPQYRSQPQQHYRPQPQQQYRPQVQQQSRPQPQAQYHAAQQQQYHAAPQPSFHEAASQSNNPHGGKR